MKQRISLLFQCRKFQHSYKLTRIDGNFLARNYLYQACILYIWLVFKLGLGYSGALSTAWRNSR